MNEKMIKCTNLYLTFVYAPTFPNSRFSVGMNISFVIALHKKTKSLWAIIKKRGGEAQGIMYIQNNKTIDFLAVFSSWTNLTKVRPLFTLSHKGSDNSRLLIVFSANNIDQSIGYFYATESRLNDFVIFKNNALRLKYAFWLVEIMMQFDLK
mgnify:CR=1 FL=1